MIDLQYYASFLAITAVFIIVILRACYYCFVAKADPINAIAKPPKFVHSVMEYLKKEKNRKKMEMIS